MLSLVDLSIAVSGFQGSPRGAGLPSRRAQEEILLPSAPPWGENPRLHIPSTCARGGGRGPRQGEGGMPWLAGVSSIATSSAKISEPHLCIREERISSGIPCYRHAKSHCDRCRCIEISQPAAQKKRRRAGARGAARKCPVLVSDVLLSHGLPPQYHRRSGA